MSDDEPEDEYEELTDISGVGDAKAQNLRDAGIETVDDIRELTQEELADTEGIGNALAARIKADVGDLEVAAETEAEVEDETPEDGRRGRRGRRDRTATQGVRRTRPRRSPTTSGGCSHSVHATANRSSTGRTTT